MKKITVLLLTGLLALTSKSQTFSIGFETGYSINHAPVAGVNLGLGFKGFVIRSGFDAHVSDHVNDGIVIQNKIGYTFNASDRIYFTGMIGHAYIYKSADNKSLNTNAFVINPEIGYKYEFREQPMSLYLGGTKAGEFKILQVGIRGYF